MAHFPKAWWKSRPLVFGHRGASRTAPENTLAAFRAAVAVGADGIELDVHLTVDGVPVVMHNASVDATTDGTGRLNEMTLAQVKELNAAAHFGQDHPAEPVPTLEEVLDAVGSDLLVNIELKGQSEGSTGLEAAVADLVARLALDERVWVSSFKPYSLFEMRQVAPDIPCGLLYSPPVLPHLLLAPVTPFEALHPHHSLISRGGVAAAHWVGRRIAAWTVDDPGSAVRLAQWNVDVLITNDPGPIAQALADAGFDG